MLPAGIWSLLNFHAIELLREYPVSHVGTAQKKKLVQELQGTFIFEDTTATDAATINSRSEQLDLPGSTPVVTLLPRDFVFNRSSRTLVLPDSHQLLLHTTLRQSGGEVEETVFLGTGNDMVNYVTENLYLIYNCNEASM